MTQRPGNQLFDAYFTARDMREVFCDQGRVQAMLDFEAALARAEARVGLIPASAVAPIADACRADLYDFAALGEAIASAGNSAIPLVKALGKQIAAADAEAERYVHLGATSQDVMDSGLVLQLRQALDLIESELAHLANSLATQAQRYAATPLAGRTWLQHATPVTLGMKIAGWLGAVTRSRQRLRELKPRLLVLQFGGASGTLAALGEQALPIAEALAEELQLTLPEQPWHTQRDRIVEFGAVLGLIAGSLGKFGRDISLLMQTEAAEVFEPSAPGKGGSSTMPHKRNPVGAAVLIGAATRVPGLVSTLFSAMPQEHERSLGLWHAEWETLPEICCLVSGALQQARLLADGLEVDAARMARNLQLTQGLVLAEAVSIVLAQRVGRDTAHHLLEQCCKRAVAEQRYLRAVLGDEPQVTAELSAAELDHLLDPAHYLGQAQVWVERAVAEHNALSD
ncbi:3-carboxy-cis,cis-muconate cycloisomerase [Pseudomonas sp. P2757]|uniref:3-carboxy-cis,cis-muconate cycloisomerase n=1 Tax=unclassified Pseudomonas TaxID=196821 RepID=UPI003B5B2D5A